MWLENACLTVTLKNPGKQYVEVANALLALNDKRLAKAPDKQKASIELFADIVNSLKDLCDGVHIISIGGEEKLRHYLDAAKLK